MTRNGITLTVNGENLEVFAKAPNWSIFRADHFQFWYGTSPDTFQPDKGSLILQYPTPLIKLIYCMQGRLELKFGETGSLSFSPFSHNICFFPAHTSITMDWEPTDNQGVLIIDLQIELFKRNFPIHLTPFLAFRNRMEKNEVASLSESSLPIEREMTSLIYDVVSCNRPNLFKPYYLKAKIIELMQLQAEQRCGSETSIKQRLRDDEVQRTHQVRDILHREPGAEHTLLNLAHRVGTNDATLKKQFKQVFGITVFQYLTAYRMQLAKKMLLTDSEKVATIAERVGYKYATHFTAAFKKHFGFLPTQVRSFFFCLLWQPPETLLTLI